MQNRNDLVYEIEEWLRNLKVLRLENLQLKLRLTDAVKESMDRRFIEQAEHFQQTLIDSDQVIDLLRHDVVNYLSRCEEITLYGDFDVAFYNIYQLLARDIERVNKEFEQMKHSFELFCNTIAR